MKNMPRRLAIIDDDPYIRELFEIAGAQSGFDVGNFESPNDFIKNSSSFRPHLVVLDLRMPGLDGIQVLERMKCAGPKPDLIVLSAADAKLRAAAARIAESNGWTVRHVLAKPVPLEELMHVLAGIEPTSEMLSEDDIRSALREKRLVLTYQPKVAIAPHAELTIEGVEVLARLDHPEKGVALPGTFIDVIDLAGMMGDFTDCVLETALKDVAELRRDGHILDVAVNISPSLLTDPDLPERLEAHVRAHCLSPSQLILEVSEGKSWPNDQQLMETLARLRIKGMRLSLDDFGTGHSSLVQLHRLPFTELKIDRSFTAEVGSNTEAKIITRSMVELAHALGLEVCAEGVETPAELAFMRSIGCDQAQGYHFGKPVVFDELRDILRNQLYSWARSVSAERAHTPRGELPPALEPLPAGRSLYPLA